MAHTSPVPYTNIHYSWIFARHSPRQYKSNCLLPWIGCVGRQLFRHPRSPGDLEISSTGEKEQMVELPRGPKQQQVGLTGTALLEDRKREPTEQRQVAVSDTGVRAHNEQQEPDGSWWQHLIGRELL